MSIITEEFQYMAFEYLLLEKAIENPPDGLKRDEFTRELFRRGLPNTYKEYSFYSDNAESVKRLTNLQKMNELVGKNAFRSIDEKFDERKNIKTVMAEISVVAINLLDFFNFHITETHEYTYARDMCDQKKLAELMGDGNFGHVLYNIRGEKKYRFQHGYKKTPMSWTRSFNLLKIGGCLAQCNSDEIWFYEPDEDEAFASKENICFTIANWFYKKFKSPFHDIYKEAREYYEKCYEKKGILFKPLEKKLSELRIPC